MSCENIVIIISFIIVLFKILIYLGGVAKAETGGVTSFFRNKLSCFGSCCKDVLLRKGRSSSSTSKIGSQLCLLASFLVEETDPSGDEKLAFGLLTLGDSGSGVPGEKSGLFTSFVGDDGAELVRSEPAEPARFLIKTEKVSFESSWHFTKLSIGLSLDSTLSGWNNVVKSKKKINK